MTKTIAQRQLRNDNGRVIDAVADGEDFVVTRNGMPIAELRPLRSRRSPFVGRAELASMVAHGPHIDSVRFRADLDGAIDQEL